MREVILAVTMASMVVNVVVWSPPFVVVDQLIQAMYTTACTVVGDMGHRALTEVDQLL